MIQYQRIKIIVWFRKRLSINLHDVLFIFKVLSFFHDGSVELLKFGNKLLLVGLAILYLGTTVLGSLAQHS